MKHFLLLLTIILAQNIHSSSFRLKGFLNDVSPDETKVLFTSKIQDNETSSSGILFVFDITQGKNIEIAKISILDYNVKSYFINNDLVLVFTNSDVYTVDLRTNKAINLNFKLDKHESICSSRKQDLGFYFSVINYNSSKLKLIKINGASLNFDNASSFSVDILPTDNFFDILILKNKNYIFDNGKLSKEFDPTYRNILFNQKYSKYSICSTKSSICFVSEEKKDRKIYIVSESITKLINIPLKVTNSLDIEPVLLSGKESILINVAGLYFLVDEYGNVKKTMYNTVYLGKNIMINRKNTHDLELLKVNTFQKK
jgi:hypothetical protein